MAKRDIAEFRRQRLAALLAHADFNGNKAALGRALGWKNGAYVWQMLEGQRPVKEDLVVKIESVRGGRYAGWFSDDQATQTIRESTTMNRGSEDAEWPLGGLITRERWDSLDESVKKAAIAAAESAVMESLIGDTRFSRKRKVSGAQ